MRKLKFRIWDKKRRHWLAQNSFTIDGLGNVGDATGHWVKDADDFSEPMQFTGLKDRNGKEIYEGDVLEAEIDTLMEARQRCVVEYKVGFYSYFQLYSDAEVIGNIYENPELLEGE